MAMITGVREVRGLMEISLDGVVWLRIRRKHFAQLNISADDAVDPDRLIDRLSSIQANDCYEAALCMLDQAAQTSADLTAKLIRKGYAAPAARAVVDRLVDNGLVDDRRYAERVAQSQLNKPVGAWSVRRKLMAKRLPEDAIDEVMEDFDSQQQSEACSQAAAKLFRKYAALPPREGRAKLSQTLARRGFSWDAIHSAVDALISEWDFSDD